MPQAKLDELVTLATSEWQQHGLRSVVCVGAGAYVVYRLGKLDVREVIRAALGVAVSVAATVPALNAKIEAEKQVRMTERHSSALTSNVVVKICRNLRTILSKASLVFNTIPTHTTPFQRRHHRA